MTSLGDCFSSEMTGYLGRPFRAADQDASDEPGGPPDDPDNELRPHAPDSPAKGGFLEDGADIGAREGTG